MSAGAIIVAAGSSQRMAGIDKMLLPLAGQPLVSYSLRAFAGCGLIDRIVIVASQDNQARIEAIAREIAPATSVVLGGKRRRDSVFAGLQSLPDCEYVLVHDGARPLVTSELIIATLTAAIETGAAICAVPVQDTVKRGDGSGLIQSTVSRHDLWLAQTPQAFRRELLIRAHAASDVDATDDAALIEWLAEPVRLVPGLPRNLKVTTTADLQLAEALLNSMRE